jgi:hypothetical protein
MPNIIRIEANEAEFQSGVACPFRRRGLSHRLEIFDIWNLRKLYLGSCGVIQDSKLKVELMGSV